MSECPLGLHGPAVTSFNQSSAAAEMGYVLVSEIKRIDETLKTLEGLSHLKICSHNNCTFDPQIPPEEIRSFVVSHLTSERREAVRKFNARFGDAT
jgi:hypothetical protein